MTSYGPSCSMLGGHDNARFTIEHKTIIGNKVPRATKTIIIKGLEPWTQIPGLDPGLDPGRIQRV